MARSDRSSGGNEEVLSPEELDIAADENVATLGGGRYVVGADGPPNADQVERVRTELVADAASKSDANTDDDGTRANTDRAKSAGDVPGGSGEITGRDVRNWIDDQLRGSESQYAYRIAAKTGSTISHQQLASDDIGMAFDALLLWYAQQVGRGTPVEDALGILLAESNVRVTHPTRRLLAYLGENDLGPNDSISDLIRAVQDDGGLVFPIHQRNQD